MSHIDLRTLCLKGVAKKIRKHYEKVEIRHRSARL